MYEISVENRHGPQSGCNYRRCGLAEPKTCPFVADDMPSARPGHLPSPSDVEIEMLLKRARHALDDFEEAIRELKARKNQL